MARPKGSRNKQPYGFAKAAKVLQEIRENVGEGKAFEKLDPDALEAVGTILGIMRGQLRGRNIHVRLQAAIHMLDRYRGKPVQKEEKEIGGTLADLIERSMELEEAKLRRESLPPGNAVTAEVLDDSREDRTRSREVGRSGEEERDGEDEGSDRRAAGGSG